ncbi:hypothetical protein G9A89_007982 [Geosiphon pyriformis]|nr:hypothetical protein G9A89_007982 [Geosiphon pyriformis]
MAIYTNAKVDAANTRIITADKVIKTPIGKIDNFPFEINGISIFIKVLVIKATQYQVLVDNDWLSKTNANCNSARIDNTHVYQSHMVTLRPPTPQHHSLSSMIKKKNLPEKPTKFSGPILNTIRKRKKKDTSEEDTTIKEITSGWKRFYTHEPLKQPLYILLKCQDWNAIGTPNDKASGTISHVSLVKNSYLTKEYKIIFLVKEEYTISCANTQSLLATGSVMEYLLTPHRTVFWYAWTAICMTKTRFRE